MWNTVARNVSAGITSGLGKRTVRIQIFSCPEISAPVTFEEAIHELSKCDVVFAPYECEQNNSIKNVIKGVSGNKNVGFIIGPEGGFAPEEIDRLTKLGVPPVTLGKRILRTETAGEAVLSMLMYEANEL